MGRMTKFFAMLTCTTALACTSVDLVKQCQNETCSDGKTAYKLCVSTSGVLVHDEYFNAAGESKVLCTSTDSDYNACVTNATKAGGPLCP